MTDTQDPEPDRDRDSEQEIAELTERLRKIEAFLQAIDYQQARAS